MKPAPFDLHSPTSLDEVVALLTEANDEDVEARVLAGGQSLVAMMNLRLARPELLVDLNRIGALDHIDVGADGHLRIGAMTRQRTVEQSVVARDEWPLLCQALPLVAHKPIRNRGTLGGSIAHADPGAELCAVGLALEAVAHVQGPSGRRSIPLSDFFVGPFMTTLEADEVLVEVSFPPLQARTGSSFLEVARRQGDFAMAGVAAVVQLEDDGTVHSARLAYIAMSSRPVRAATAEQLLMGESPAPTLFARVAEAAAAELDPSDDIHASAAFRSHLARVLTERALAEAVRRASA